METQDLHRASRIHICECPLPEIAPSAVASSTYVVAAPADYCPLQTAQQALTDRLYPLALAAGLPDFSFSSSRAYAEELGWYTHVSISAKPVGTEWTTSQQLRAYSNTLTKAEAAFRTALVAYQGEQQARAEDADPAHRGHATATMYQHLAQQATMMEGSLAHV